MATIPLPSVAARVRKLIADPSTPVATRNECHRLLVAVERNEPMLIEESLERLDQLADDAKIKTPE